MRRRVSEAEVENFHDLSGICYRHLQSLGSHVLGAFEASLLP